MHEKGVFELHYLYLFVSKATLSNLTQFSSSLLELGEYFNVMEHQRSNHNIIVLRYKYTLYILILNATYENTFVLSLP